MKCKICDASITMDNASGVKYTCRLCNQSNIRARKSRYRQWMEEYRSTNPGVSSTDWLVQTGRAHRAGTRVFLHY